MRVVLDGRAMLVGPGGIPRYAKALVELLPRFDLKRSYAIFSSRRSVPKLTETLDSARVVTTTLPIRISLALNDYGRLKAPTWGLGRCDVFHTVSGLPIRFRDASTVSMFHDCAWRICPELVPDHEAERLDRGLRNSLRWKDHIVTDSMQAKADLLNNYPLLPENVTVIYPALDPSLTPETEANGTVPAAEENLRPYILYVAPIQRKKNTLRLVRSFARISRTVHHDLVLAGTLGWDPDYVRAVRNECSTLSVGERVQFRGTVGDHTLRELYRGCSLFVFPSLYEGFGLPPVEAMAWGKPVLASKVASLPEVVADAGLLVDPYSEDELAEGMLALLTDEGLRSQLMLRAVKRAAFFSVDRMVTAYQDLYDRIA